MTLRTQDPVLVREQGHLGRITLNRPDSVNALTREMVVLITRALDQWEGDDAITSVLIDGAGDRGLCAGGDLRADDDDPSQFLRAEFWMNARIAEYPKPYVAWMDGITMGGGVGISAHGAVRVVTERSRVAMPETRIGLSPDVGGTFLLARAPGLLGLHLGLTSSSMTGQDAVAAGFADLQLPSGAYSELATALERGDEPRAAAQRLAVDPGPSRLLADCDWIDECYDAGTLPEVLERLRAAGGDAAAAADRISSFSPTATTVAFAAIHRAAGLSLRDCLSMEFVIMNHLATRADVGEGVRATILDRTHTPRWSPARLEEVDAGEVARLIRQLPTPSLW
ncbi:enoyl-CoA hydratase/isomerase family protein [Lacisediminihabitans sp. FW035]